jgi:lipoprotein LprG
MTLRRPLLEPVVASALASALLLGTAGCSGGDDDKEGPGDTLASAKSQLDETSGVRLRLTTDELPDGVDGVLDAKGVGTHAPAFDGDIKLLFNGVSVDVPVVAVDGTVWAKIPFTTGFSDIDPAEYGAPDPAALMDPDTGVSTWLTEATAVEKGDQVRDGEEVLTEYTGTLAGETIAEVIPSADETADFDVTFHLDDDDRLVSADLSGPFYGDAGDVDYTLELSDYGVEQDITRP